MVVTTLGYSETNSFVAHLDDDNGAISGTITEPDTRAIMACGGPSSAAIEAERNSGP